MHAAFQAAFDGATQPCSVSTQTGTRSAPLHLRRHVCIASSWGQVPAPCLTLACCPFGHSLECGEASAALPPCCPMSSRGSDLLLRHKEQHIPAQLIEYAAQRDMPLVCRVEKAGKCSTMWVNKLFFVMNTVHVPSEEARRNFEQTGQLYIGKALHSKHRKFEQAQSITQLWTGTAPAYRSSWTKRSSRWLTHARRQMEEVRDIFFFAGG